MLYPPLNFKSNRQHTVQISINNTMMLKNNGTLFFFNTIFAFSSLCSACNLNNTSYCYTEKTWKVDIKEICIRGHFYFYSSCWVMLYSKKQKSPACHSMQRAFIVYCAKSGCMRGCLLFFSFPNKKSDSSATHETKKKKRIQQSQYPYTTAISRETSRENLKEECVTQLLTPSQKWCFFSNILQESDFIGADWRMYEFNLSILLCSRRNYLRIHTKTNYTAVKKVEFLHLGEELGLWGMLGPTGLRMPWQLSVTSRQMIAVLPDPALPTMTAPRPSQLLVFLSTSSRRVKSQSRPTKGVSAVMPGTSNSSGFSMMSACLNATNLPGGIERENLKLHKNG